MIAVDTIWPAKLGSAPEIQHELGERDGGARRGYGEGYRGGNIEREHKKAIWRAILG